MQPYEVTYMVAGKYQNTVIVQADDTEGARDMVAKWNLIPLNAEITKIESRR